MNFDYGTETYNALSKVLKLKFGRELKDSGIELQELYLMKNIVSGKENYLIIVNNRQIRFVTPYDFVSRFIRFLNFNIQELDKKYNELIGFQINEYTDTVAIEMQYKEVDCFRFKQRILINKMIGFRDAVASKRGN